MITESIIKLLFNTKMERYARMLRLDINSEDKSIELEVLLRGESAPLKIHIGRYEIMTGDESGIKISQIHTSREWMTEMIQAFMPEYKVNFNNAKLLKMIM